MKFDYNGVDSTNLTVDNVCRGMEDNCSRIQSAMVGKLESLFSGEAASVASPLIRKFVSDLENHRSNCGQVRVQIARTSGSEGFMKQTDSAQGARFMALG